MDTSKRYGKNQISGEDIENFVSAIVKFGTETTVISPVQQQDEPKKAKQNGESSYDDDDYRPPRKSRQGSNGDARKKKRRTGRSSKKKPSSMNIGELDDSNDEKINNQRRNNAIGVKTEPVQVPKQCLGPSCVNPARVESKYCSDECGIGLAKKYIITNKKKNFQQPLPSSLTKSSLFFTRICLNFNFKLTRSVSLFKSHTQLSERKQCERNSDKVRSRQTQRETIA